MKLPLYVRLDMNNSQESIQIGAAGKFRAAHEANTIVTLKVTLDIDETMFAGGVIDTGATIMIGPASIDAATIVAGLKQIDKDIKDAVVV